MLTLLRTILIGTVNPQKPVHSVDKVLLFALFSAILTLPIRCTGLKTIRQ
jgi:hypothetical protein